MPVPPPRPRPPAVLGSIIISDCQWHLHAHSSYMKVRHSTGGGGKDVDGEKNGKSACGIQTRRVTFTETRDRPQICARREDGDTVWSFKQSDVTGGRCNYDAAEPTGRRALIRRTDRTQNIHTTPLSWKHTHTIAAHALHTHVKQRKIQKICTGRTFKILDFPADVIFNLGSRAAAGLSWKQFGVGVARGGHE